MRKTFSNVLAEYGVIALVLYLLLFCIVLVGAYFAIRAGWAPKSVAGQTGTWVAAYIVTKLTSPFRLAGAIALSPIVARVIERMRGRPTSPPRSDITP